MSISTIAFIVFMLNPAGELAGFSPAAKVPFLADGEKTSVQYDTQEQCDAALAVKLASLNEKLNTLYTSAGAGNSEVSYRRQQARINSLKCLQVDRVPSDDPEVPESNPVVKKLTPTPSQALELMDVWRVGRFDKSRVFFGTEYNTTVYQDQSGCISALKNTHALVMDNAYQATGSSSEAVNAVERFKDTYDCHQITVDANAPAVKPMPNLAEEYVQAGGPVGSVAELSQEAPEISAPGPSSAAYSGPRQRIREYLMAEQVKQSSGQWKWVKYASVYSTPSQCWGAVKTFLASEKENISGTFQQMQPTYESAEWFRTSLLNLEQRRRKIACVSSLQ